MLLGEEQLPTDPRISDSPLTDVFPQGRDGDVQPLCGVVNCVQADSHAGLPVLKHAIGPGALHGFGGRHPR